MIFACCNRVEPLELHLCLATGCFLICARKRTRRILRSSQDSNLDSLNSGQMFSPTEPLALKERIDGIYP